MGGLSITLNSTASTYSSSSNARNLIRLLRKPSYSPLPTLPSTYSLLDFRPNNPPSQSICLKIRRFSSYHSRFSHNLTNYTSASSNRSIPTEGKDFSATTTDKLKGEAKMTVGGEPCIKDGSIMVNGRVVLTGVPSNVSVYPVTDGLSSSSSSSSPAFIGASSSVPGSRHVFGLGVLQ